MSGPTQPLDNASTVDRWARIEALFHAAADVPPAARAAFLTEACGGDSAVRAEVESLLLADDAGTLDNLRPFRLPTQETASPAAPDYEVAHLAAASLVGHTISHYEIVGLLGAGGMGLVYLARDTALLRQVAIKMLPSAAASDGPALTRFTTEARAASALQHPNVATVYEMGETERQPFIAMEYVDGATLEARLREGPLSLDDALDVAVQVAAALEAAHEAGIVHRDIKPANIMLTPRGVVKVLDFGIAKLRSTVPADGSEPAGTQAGLVLGTIDYMSPEQALAAPVDHRSDLFSMGVVLYQSLTGDLPFRRPNVTATLDALLHAEPVRLSTRVSDLPEAVDRVLARALAKDPAGRYQNASQMATDLAALRQRSEPPGARHMPRGRSRWVMVAAVTVAAALVGITLWAGWGRRSESPAPSSTPTLIPFTSYAGSESSPAYSPDGQQIAFVWDGPDRSNPDVYVQSRGGAPARLTTHPAAEVAPVFSPDGQWIAFVRDAEGAMLVPRAGGPARAIGPVGHARVAFTPDGRALVAGGSRDGGGLEVIPLDGGPRRVLTRPPRGVEDGAPAFSPDGSRLTFLRMPGPAVADIWEADASGGTPRRLTFDDRSLEKVVWSRDGRTLIFGSSRGGARRLWRVDRTSGRLEVLADAGLGAAQPAVSPSEPQLAFVSTVEDSNIWQIELDASGTPGPPRPGAGQSSWLDSSPDFAQDGVHLVFASNRNGGDEIFYGTMDGVAARQVTDFSRLPAGVVGSPRLSPDGKRIAFDARVRGNADIYVAPVAGGHPTRLTTSDGVDVVPIWSLDGVWIYFTSRRTGRPEAWRIPAAGGHEEQVTREGAFAAQPSADGRELIYARTRDRSTLFRRPLAGGAESPALVDASGQPRFVATFSAWRPTRDGIVFIEEVPQRAPGAGAFVVQAYDYATRRVRRLALLTAPPAGGLAVSPDGRRILFTQMDQQRSDINLLDAYR